MVLVPSETRSVRHRPHNNAHILPIGSGSVKSATGLFSALGVVVGFGAGLGQRSAAGVQQEAQADASAPSLSMANAWRIAGGRWSPAAMA